MKPLVFEPWKAIFFFFFCRYEENYLTRLPVTKEELRRKKRISTLGTLGDEITRFENTSILHKEQDFSSEKKKSRKRKAAKGKKNSRGNLILTNKWIKTT